MLTQAAHNTFARLLTSIMMYVCMAVCMYVCMRMCIYPLPVRPTLGSHHRYCAGCDREFHLTCLWPQMPKPPTTLWYGPCCAEFDKQATATVGGRYQYDADLFSCLPAEVYDKKFNVKVFGFWLCCCWLHCRTRGATWCLERICDTVREQHPAIHHQVAVARKSFEKASASCFVGTFLLQYRYHGCVCWKQTVAAWMYTTGLSSVSIQ